MKATALRAYIEQHNRFARVFAGKGIARTFSIGWLTDADAQELFNKIENELSPENLHCDGEASPAYVRSRYKALMGAKQDLVALGFKEKAYV